MLFSSLFLLMKFFYYIMIYLYFKAIFYISMHNIYNIYPYTNKFIKLFHCIFYTAFIGCFPFHEEFNITECVYAYTNIHIHMYVYNTYVYIECTHTNMLLLRKSMWMYVLFSNHAFYQYIRGCA